MTERRPMPRSRPKKILIEEKIPDFEEKILKLEELATELLETARELPPGTRRHDLLKEVSSFRVRIAALRKSGTH
jgi:hypothetical protein